MRLHKNIQFIKYETKNVFPCILFMQIAKLNSRHVHFIYSTHRVVMHNKRCIFDKATPLWYHGKHLLHSCQAFIMWNILLRKFGALSIEWSPPRPPPHLPVLVFRAHKYKS